MQEKIKDKTCAVVIPTIRPKKIGQFLKDWNFNCRVFIVYDGKEPVLKTCDDKRLSVKQVMGKYNDLITNLTAAVRNLGFAYIAKQCPEVEYIITLDDDLKPIGDTVQDHVNALNMRVPISWTRTGTEYTRGFPYGVRNEAEVVLSHGIWGGIADYDAPTQLVKGNVNIKFYKEPIPKGVYYPMSSMNLAFKRKMLPFMYMAPRVYNVHRFDDIFCGINSKREIDKRGWAVVSGFAAAYHEKASNVFNNLEKEAKGIRLNEEYWKGEDTDRYFKVYHKKLERWKEFMK